MPAALRMALLCALALLALTALPTSALAAPDKLASCNACHNANDADGAAAVYIDGAASAAIELPNDGSGSFEVDFVFTNATDAPDFEGIGLEVAVPAGWSVTAGTGAFAPPGWHGAWDNAAGVGLWSGPYDTLNEYPAQPEGYTINFDGSPWDTGSRDAACDMGGACSAGVDLDGSAETMGADAVVTVPAGTAPGTYLVRLHAAGHHNAVRTHAEALIAVTVTADVNSALGEIAPTSVVAGSAANAMTFDILPTITGIAGGVDRVVLSAPAGYASLAVTSAAVDGGPLTANCPAPAPGQYCATVATPLVTVDLGSTVSADQANIRIGFSADAPATLGRDAFVASVDNSATARPPVAVTVGNADGDAGDANTLSVDTTGNTLTWVGGTSSDFGAAANWSPAQIPSAAYSCVIENYASFEPAIVSNQACGSLSLGGGAQPVTLTFTGANSLAIASNVVIGANGRLAPAGVASGTFSVGGNWSDDLATTNFTSADLQLAFEFDGLSEPLTSNESFHSLQVRGDIALNSDLRIADRLDIAGGGRLTQGPHTVFMNGPTLILSGDYDHSCASTLEVSSALGLQNGAHYPNLTLTGGADVTGANPAYVDCDLTLQPGSTLAAGAALFVDGDWVNNGGAVTPGAGRVTLTGADAQIGGTTPSTFYDLAIGDHPADSVASPLDLAIDHDLTVNAGATLTLAADRNIAVDRNTTVAGTLELSGATTWSQSGGSNTGIIVAPGGLLRALGTNATERVTFTRSDASYYQLVCNGGLDFNYVNLFYTQSAAAGSGLAINSAAGEPLRFDQVAINHTDNINNATMLLWNADRALSAFGVTFDSASYAQADGDVNVEAAKGTLTLVGAGGNYAGEPLDNDSGGLAIWDNPAFVISGKVFEDPNYGGGAGRSLAGSGGAVRPGARVELYDAAGSFVTAVNTDVDGSYAFPAGIGDHRVRVVNATVGSSRPGAVAGLLPVQTFRTDASSGAAVADPNRVGGEDPTRQDAGANPGTAALADLTTAAATPQSLAPVTLSVISIGGVDFGFNFDTVVNTNDSGQGSLRQFLTNANALTGNGALAQQGLAAGKESAIFMISDGTARPGLRAGLPDQLSAGVARITPSSPLPPLLDADTVIDGATQTANVGDTNAAVLGAGGSAGADALAVATVGAPEVELADGGANLPAGLEVQGDNCAVKALALYGFGNGGATEGNIRVSGGAGTLIEGNVLGSAATAFADPGAARTEGHNLVVTAGGGTVRGNLIGYGASSGFRAEGAGLGSWSLEGNEIRGNGLADPSLGGIAFHNDTGSATIVGNLVADNRGAGIDTEGSAGGKSVLNNTVTGNGIGTGASAVSAGVRLYGSENILDRNLIEGNFGPGVLVTSGAAANTLIGNRIAANGTILDAGGGGPSNQIGIDLSDGAPCDQGGCAPYVTANDAGDGDGGANGLLNTPELASVVVAGGSIVCSFALDAAAGDYHIEFFASAAADGSGYGEGETFLGTATVTHSGGGSETFAATLADPGVAAEAVFSATATLIDGSADGFGATSEFGPNAQAQEVAIVKRAFLPDGTPLADGVNLPAGTLIHFLLYISNGGGALYDVSVRDALPAAFSYQDGTLRVAATADACAGAACTALEEDAVLTAAKAAPLLTDNKDGDGVNYDDATATIDAGDQNVAGNGRQDVPAGKAWALLFEATAN